VDSKGLLERKLARRRLLQAGAFGGISAFLAACSGGNSASSSTAASQSASASTSAAASGSASASAAATPVPSPTGPLKWATWPAYIDLTGKAGEEGKYAPGASPSIEAFKKKYGVDVDYQEKIEANEDFYATIQPQLQGGLATGWDLITVTDWLAAKIISKGWAEKIDQGNVPNATKNLRDPLRNQSWDPGNDYHYPWQSGMTGIGYNTKTLASAKVAPPKSLADLWTIRADRLTFLNEKRDTFGLGLLKLGKKADPATITADDLQAVHDDIKPLVDKGLRFTGNEYLQDFAAKKVYAAMVWSGDLASSGTEGDTWAFPTEGTMIWTDNVLIPKGAANKYTAELMINFVYDPKIAAQIENYVYYVSPVKGAEEELKNLNKASPLDDYHLSLLFPPDDVIAKQQNFQFLSDELEAKMNELYADLAGV
jgi:spermidine/putrescine transport system substrate-binding protein